MKSELQDTIRPIYIPVGKIQNPETGTHQAVIQGFYALGTQTSEKFGDSNKILLCFELADEFRDDGEPFTLYRTYTRSLSPKSNLFRDIGTIIGLTNQKPSANGFDISSVLGRNCLLDIEITDNAEGKTWARIKSVMQLPKKDNPRKSINPLVRFDFDGEIPEGCPEWISKLIKASPEWKDYCSVKENGG